jgi:hypothetical protein
MIEGKATDWNYSSDSSSPLTPSFSTRVKEEEHTWDRK